MKTWYQVKEQAAGEKRLMLMWYIYKLLGKKAVNFIAFFVTLSAFIFAKEVRGYSKKYLTVISKYTPLKPSLINQFKHFLSYARVLTDKIEIFSNNFDKSKIIYNSQAEKEKLYSDIDAQNGVFFLCSHIGNTEVMRTFLVDNSIYPNLRVNAFMSKNQCKIFNNFIKKIAKEIPLTPFPVEDIGIDTSIIIKENLEKGQMVFIAGDRVAENSKSATFTTKLFGETVEFPTGSFKLAQLMEVPIYFIAALKAENDTYKIYLENHNFTTLPNLETAYVKFLEKITLISPFQFYHFYDLFQD